MKLDSETLQKISASVCELQKTNIASRAENNADFIDIESQMKALENFSGTTLQTQTPVFVYVKLSNITLVGQPIVWISISTQQKSLILMQAWSNLTSRWLFTPLQVGSQSNATLILGTLHERLAWSLST
ncbi:hypothetical protein DVH24_008151 [Malus domestica]|uniref:Uncharacterized protein n=1 Tax=Malus domestica TaxID=3750 RepID=A0A498JQW9_MALDO|nr:hypothetical protein DVH24_008151 [Malus domestica]